MKIAIQTEIPNLEASFLATLFPNHSVDIIMPWDFKLHEVYDVAFCIGPNASSVNAHVRVLMVFGDSSVYKGNGYDVIVTTNNRALENCEARFGDKKYFKIELPVLDLEAGRRRLSEEKFFYTNYSNNPDIYFPVKGLRKIYKNWTASGNYPLFNVGDFNTFIRKGGIGYYDGSTDGYDVQVKRHLALGGRVVIEEPDEKVIGTLIKYIDNGVDFYEPMPKRLMKSIGPVDCAGSKKEYEIKIKNLLYNI
jgi:hypothetical protein